MDLRSALDAIELPIQCANCAHQFRQSVARARAQPNKLCPACGAPMRFDIDLNALEREIKRHVRELREALKKQR